MKFSDMPLVACSLFMTEIEEEQRAVFESEWRADKTVLVRKFRRNVRAGGTWISVWMIVVRRKV